MGPDAFPERSAAPETARRPGIGVGGLLLGLCVCLCTLASGYLGAWLQVRPLVADLATRPPVIILDARDVLQGLPADQVGAVIARQRALARRLADGGVLVLDRQAVVEAPAALVVRTGPEAPGQEGRP
ncbi:hypothetical protein [uncultured Lamprocystis sp.]|jgi:hypothetical protein|uniref:hypothetical protein n=1 Tax=uncultured Lamprocystis sp. TaxID=543132 RepID=UPI0025D7A19D|nr:hypothetical protein [uncultured Lamprocystis sp.]